MDELDTDANKSEYFFSNLCKFVIVNFLYATTVGTWSESGSGSESGSVLAI